MRSGMAIVSLCALVASPAVARPPASGGRDLNPSKMQVQSSMRCAALFGDRSSKDDNRKLRLEGLDWIEEEEGGVTVAHMNPRWEEPIRVTIRGLTLEEIEEPTARVRVSAEVARATGCAPGSYTLTMDQMLGPRVRVLSVLTSGLLIDHEGRLGFIGKPGASEPRWLLAWRLRAEVPYARAPTIRTGRYSSSRLYRR